MRNKRKWFFPLSVLALVLMATVAIAGERLTSVPEPADEDVSARKAAQNSDESELEGPTAAELQEAREAAAREQIIVETYGPEAVHRSALEGNGPEVPPPHIAAALDDASRALLKGAERILIASQSNQEGSTRMESATYSDGTGIVELIWQVWPQTVDLQGVLQEGTLVEQDGALDITIREMVYDNMIEVGVFDGYIYARAYTTFTDDMTLGKVRDLATRLYNAVSSSN